MGSCEGYISVDIKKNYSGLHLAFQYQYGSHFPLRRFKIYQTSRFMKETLQHIKTDRNFCSLNHYTYFLTVKHHSAPFSVIIVIIVIMIIISRS